MSVVLYDPLVKGFAGPEGLVTAAQVGASQGNLQTVLDNLDVTRLNWKFDNVGVNPSAGFLGVSTPLNLSTATTLAFALTSNSGSAKFNELFEAFQRGDRVFLHERKAVNTNVLYRVTGPATVDATKASIPVVAEQSEGTTFTANAEIDVRFFPLGSGDSLRFSRDNSSVLRTIDATSPTTFASSLSGVTVIAGNAFRVVTGGTPFGGTTIRVEIGDVLVATVDSPSLTAVANWALLEKPKAPSEKPGAPPTDPSQLEQRVQNLESKVAALFPLTTSVSDLVAWAKAYSPRNATQEFVRLAEGYSLFADFRSPSSRFQSAGVVFDDTGTNVIRYTGLTNNLHRLFGVKPTGPANQVLLWAVEDTELIPVFDMTSTGNFRVNSHTFSIDPGDVVTDHFVGLTKTSGVDTLDVNEVNVTTYTIAPFPAGSTNQSRTLQFQAQIIVEGQNTFKDRNIQLDAPSTLTAQARRTLTTVVYLGPRFGNDGVRITISYTYRVSGSDLLADIRLVSQESKFLQPVGIRLINVFTVQNYVAAGGSTRVDSFQTLKTLAGADYTFSGSAELLVSFHPQSPNTSIKVTPTVRESDGTRLELRDVVVPKFRGGFASVEIPDTIDFRTAEADHFLTTAELLALLLEADTEWVYKLAERVVISEDQITDILDFINGLVVIAPNSDRRRIVVDNTGNLSTVLET